MADSMEMPRYKCHKEVWALKIKEVQLVSGEGTPDGAKFTKRLVFENSRYAPIEVDADYVRKHNPQTGGYYVVYGDGYKSFSPAQAFEEGYTLIE